jgi:hypothetical protein
LLESVSTWRIIQASGFAVNSEGTRSSIGQSIGLRNRGLQVRLLPGALRATRTYSDRSHASFVSSVLNSSDFEVFLADIAVPFLQKCAFFRRERGRAEDRCRLGITLDQAKRALVAAAEYHGDKGNWPDALDVLIPAYLTQNPTDIFSTSGTEPVQYHKTDAGICLLAHGPSGGSDVTIIGTVPDTP